MQDINKSRDTDKRQTQVTLSTMKHPTVYPPSEHIFLYLLLIGGKLLYNIALNSAIHQHEPATGIHMSTLS